MLTTTDAIVLSLQPQSDKAHVLHAYTRSGGRVNFRVYGLGRKHPIGMYLPLSLIRITADFSPAKPAAVKEAVPLASNQSPLAYNPYKRAIALFLSEVLYHVLRHPMPDEPMFDFLLQAVQTLEQTEEPQNFHLQFLIDFAAKLGFAIPETSLEVSTITNNQSPLTTTPLTRKERQQTLRALCDYFAEHVETWQSPKSLDILMEVFD